MTKVAKYAGINPSDDGPSAILNATKGDFSSAQVTQYCVESKDLKGAIIPSANFEPLPIAISAERTAVALAHVAHNSVQRTLRMDDDRFSGISRPTPIRTASASAARKIRCFPLMQKTYISSIP